MRHTIALLFCIIFNSVEVSTERTWATIPLNVPLALTDDGQNLATLPVLFGTPPQEINMTVDITTQALAAFSSSCILCPGTSFFDTTLSTTFQPTNSTWLSDGVLDGILVNDQVSFGGLLNSHNQRFILGQNGLANIFELSRFDGHFGALINATNTTQQSQHIFTQLYEANQLLNPVVGMRFDPQNPKMTIGALDPADYEGQINWVQMETPVNTWDFPNIFPIDGIKGYNGSFVPWGNNLLATVNSLYYGIGVPNDRTYTNDTGYIGPNTNYNSGGGSPTSLQCNMTTPYIALTATINGVDYRMDSLNNLLRPSQNSYPAGFCGVGIANRSLLNPPDIDLGLPFLRSVYLAYRFPTDNCPGYYGFAFPAGANRTQAEINQTPTSTPSQSAQCLSLTKPTTTPTASIITAQHQLLSKNMYDVYTIPQAGQVPLMGVDDLPRKYTSTGLSV